MATLDLIGIKQNIRNVLRNYLYPQCTYSVYEHTLSSSSYNIDIAQSFIPYSQCYNNVSPYRYSLPVTLQLKKVGTPDDDIVVSLHNDVDDSPSATALYSTTIPSSKIGTVMNTVSCTLTLTSMLGSNTKYWLVIEPQNTPDTLNCYVLGRDTVDTHYWMGTAKYRTDTTWSSLNADIYFDIDIPDWIYEDFPRIKMTIYRFPRIGIGISGRPRVENIFIDSRIAYYHLLCDIVVYGRYPDQVEDIISYVDRALFKERVKIPNLVIVNPSNMTPLTVARENLFAKGIQYMLKFKMTT